MTVCWTKVAGFMLAVSITLLVSLDAVTAESECRYPDGGTYGCPEGYHCCDVGSCCRPRTHLYRTEWFWLVWAGVIVAAAFCACAYRHKRCSTIQLVCCFPPQAAAGQGDDSDISENQDELDNVVDENLPFLPYTRQSLADKPPSYFEVVFPEETDSEQTHVVSEPSTRVTPPPDGSDDGALIHPDLLYESPPAYTEN